MNKTNHGQLDTIYCDLCNTPVVQSNGQFLRSVIVICGACRRRNEYHPQRKSLDKDDKKDDKADVTH
jgi:hypothetical protein